MFAAAAASLQPQHTCGEAAVGLAEPRASSQLRPAAHRARPAGAHARGAASSPWGRRAFFSERVRHFSGRTVERSLAGPAAQGRQAARDGCSARAASGARASASGEGSSSGAGGPSDAYDAVVIGAGIGGLVCAGMLALYGRRVLVLESHSVPGGAAHSFERDGFHFDSGPSFFCGLSAAGGSTNPLRQALDLLGEADSLDFVRYGRWDYHLGPPDERPFQVSTDAAAYREEVARFSPQGARELERLEAALAPYHAATRAIPAMALRPDAGVLRLLFPAYGLAMASMAPLAASIQGPASALIDREVREPFLRRLLDLECFVLSGLPADGTILAEFAFMMGERAAAPVEYPVGGSQAIVDALVRGIRRHGGEVRCGAHVERVLLEGGRAVGVALRGGGRVRAGAVVSNASVWDTAARLLAPEDAPAAWRREALATPACGSFMHLHAGIRAEGLPADLLCHHCVVLDPAAPVDAPGNVVIISIPSLFDPALAPPGHHAVHAYTAGSEPWEDWAGLKRGSAEYEARKAERGEALWRALERVIPDARARATMSLLGTPLTHARYLRRHRGSYGPAIAAGEASFPGPRTPVPGLLRCGDSCLPGIGVPAVAASGMLAAHALVGVPQQRAMLARLP